jgi:hypothetical protein
MNFPKSLYLLNQQKLIQCPGTNYHHIGLQSDSEGPTKKSMIFTKCMERRCVVVFPKVLQLNLDLLRTLPADEGLNIRWEFLPDLTRL